MKELYKKLCKFELICAIICLIISVSVIFISAVLRTIGHPINWALDIALLLFTWSTFLGGDIAFRHNQMVNVDFFVKKFPDNIQKLIKLLCYIIILAVLIWLTYLGIVLCIKSRARSFQGIPGFSYSWVTLSVPVSFIFMTITTIRKIYHEYLLKDVCEAY